MLECISEWAVTYAMGDNPMEVTKYKQAYTDLMKSRVKFPQKNIFFQKKPPENQKQSATLKEEKSSGLRNSINNPISNKFEEKKETKPNLTKANSSYNDPTINKPPVINKPVEKPVPIKKPEPKPTNNERMVKDARESLEYVKNSISFLLDMEEISKN